MATQKQINDMCEEAADYYDGLNQGYEEESMNEIADRMAKLIKQSFPQQFKLAVKKIKDRDAEEDDGP